MEFRKIVRKVAKHGTAGSIVVAAIGVVLIVHAMTTTKGEN